MGTTSRVGRRPTLAAVLAASLLIVGLVAPASAAWVDETVTNGWWMATPSLAMRSDDKTGVAWSRWGSDRGIFYATDATGGWVTTRLTTASDVDPRLVFDGDDHAHVVMTRYGSDRGIWYATDATGSWVVSKVWADDAGSASIAVDAAGKVHIAYQSWNFTPGIYYVTDVSGSWIRTRISTGFDAEPSLVLDAAGKPHIAFARFAPEDHGIYLATNALGSWTTGWRTTGIDGAPSLALDGSGKVHIAFVRYDSTQARAFYLTDVTGDWVGAELPTDFGGFYASDAGRPSLALDGTGVVQVTFARFPHNPVLEASLVTFQRSGDSWVPTSWPSDIGGRSDDQPSIAFDSTGGFHLAYQRSEPSAGVMVFTSGTPTMLSASSLDIDPALVTKASGPRHLAYSHVDGSSTHVRYGTDAGAGWTTAEAGAMTSPGPVDLAVDGNGKARVAGGGLYLSNTIGTWVADTTLPWGAVASVATDAANHAHVVFLSSSTSWTVYYRTDATGTWVEDWITPGASHDSPPDQPALAVDSAGKAHVAFASDGALIYLTNVTGAWSPETSILVGGLSHPDIAVDAGGKIHMVYNRSASNPGTYYATNTTGSWVTTRLTRTYADQAPSIALDPSGKVYVGVARDSWAANPGVYLITNRTGSWVTSLVRPSYGTADASVAVGAGGLVEIAYDDPSSGISIVSESNGPATTPLRNVTALDVVREAIDPDRTRTRSDGRGPSPHAGAPGGTNH